jgi:signal transduction histidine kinase
VKRPISFWRYCLRQELVALSVALGVLGSVSWLAVREVNRRYINLHRADADRVQLLLQEPVGEAMDRFRLFRDLDEETHTEAASYLMDSFSDIYHLDHELRVVKIHKQIPGRRVFEGFSFSGSKVARHLQHSYLQHSHRQDKLANNSAKGDSTFQASPIIRAAEDEVASIYLGLPAKSSNTLLLGRLNLSYIQNFLRRFAAISGSPLLLVNNDGQVMLSSNRDLPIASIDLRAALKEDLPRPIEVGSTRWLPIAGSSRELGSPFITLVPTRPMEQYQQVLGIASLAVSLLLVLIFILKARRLHTNLFNPVRTFADQLRLVESGHAPSEGRETPQQQHLAVAGERFLEIRLIQERFTAMVAAIQHRESELRQALRASLAAAAVGHEIKQPLSTIRLLCQQASRSDSSGGLRPLLSQLDRESSRVATTVESMRMLLSNVQSNQEPLDLAAAASNAITFTHHQRRSLGVAFRAEGVNGLPLDDSPLPVIGDPVQLQIAIGNLLRNGAEAAATMVPERRRRLRLRLQRLPASAEHPHGLAGLEVADSGPGLPGLDGSGGGDHPGRELGRQPLRTTKAHGSGLGLFVVRTTLEQHGGWLQAGRSAELGGAAVSLWLPLRPPHEA